MSKMVLLCPACRSSNVVVDANATWDANAQTFVLAGVMDHMTCEDCGYENTIGFELMPSTNPNLISQEQNGRPIND
jgi:hypothetical protein